MGGQVGTSKWMSRARGRAGEGVRPASGAMTAAMSALPGASSKVLRIALARAGKIVEERVVRERATVTCGASELATFTVGGRAPESHALFVAENGRYHLSLAEGMSGRVALSTGLCDVASLLAQGVRRIDIDDDARGKIVLGDTSIIFQLVDAPEPARAKLPLAVRRHLGIDWNLTVIAAFSFLFHFGIVGASYSDFADPVHDEGSIVSVVDTIKNLPSPIDIESTPALDQTAPTPTPDATSPAPNAPKPTPVANGPRSTPTTPGVSPSEAEQARLAILLAYGPGKKVAVLDPNAPMLPGGVWIDRPGKPGDPNMITKPDVPLFVPPGGPEPVPTTTVHVDPNPVVITKPALPPVVVNPEPPVGPVDPAPVAGLSGRARYCYQQALLKNPNQSGRVVISIKVGPSGDVVGSNVLSNSGLDASVGQCILGGVQNMHFKSPGPAGGQLNVPFTFIKQ